METGIRKGQYAVVTAAYWAFTLTDGALRMLVLLYLHQMGRTPLEIAGLFLFYEFFGIVTNLAGGALGARFGLRLTLLLGLTLQVIALGVLGWQHAALNLWWILGMQGLSGIAKDLTKMSSKSYMKFLVAAGDSQGLMRIVAWLTGSKNTLKGAGFFLGGWLLGQFGFQYACWGMAGALILAFLVSALALPKTAGKAKSVGRPKDWLTQDGRILWLSASRLALFAARDIWFVLALPLFLATRLEWSHSQVGGFLALWVIGYGIVQATAPGWLRIRSQAQALEVSAPTHQAAGGKLAAWTLSLTIPIAWLAFGAELDALRLVLGLGLFGLLFATCSALHSFLIVAYAHGDRVAQQVGAYYSANATGRLLGTLLSGLLYQRAQDPNQGLVWALWGSGAFVLIAALLCWPLARQEKRLWAR